MTETSKPGPESAIPPTDETNDLHPRSVEALAKHFVECDARLVLIWHSKTLTVWWRCTQCGALFDDNHADFADADLRQTGEITAADADTYRILTACPDELWYYRSEVALNQHIAHCGISYLEVSETSDGPYADEQVFTCLHCMFSFTSSHPEYSYLRATSCIDGEGVDL